MIRRLFASLALVALLCVGLSFSPPPDPVTYYVNTAAAAGGDGTTQELTGAHCAWDTIADVNAASFSAGDSVLFNRGCTWREQLTVPSSGSAGLPITLGAYGTGAKPMINGTALQNTSGDWTQDPSETTLSNLVPGVGADDGHWIVETEGYWNDANELVAGDAGGGIYTTNAFVRFPSVNVPKDATIVSATITIRSIQTEANDIYLKVHAVTEDNATAPTSFADAQGRSLTAGVDWDMTVYDTGEDYTSPDISAAIQAIVDRAGWVANQAICIYIKDDGSGPEDYAKFNPRELSATTCSRLTITYDAGTSVNWYLSSVTSEPGVLIADGVVGNHKTTKGALASQWDYWWDDPNDRLYVYSDGNPTTQATNIEVGARNCVDTMTQNYITFDGVNFYGAKMYGCLVWGATNVIFSDCAFNYIGRTPIQFNNGGAGAVDGCAFYEWNLEDYDGGMGVHVIKNGATESGPVDVNDSTFQMARVCVGNQVSAICSDDGGWVRTCTGNTINTIYVGAGISIYYPSSAATVINVSNNSIIDVYGIPLEVTGLEINGGTPTVTVAYNYIENGCLADTLDVEAIRLRAFTTASDVTVAYNIINGTYDGGNAHHGIQNKGADGSKIYNNVIYGCDNGIEVNDESADHSIGLDVRNNICSTNRGYGLNLAADNTITTWGYNCWYDNNLGNLNGKAAGTGDVTSDPAVAVPGSDFRLQHTSPCINAGTDVGLQADYAGTRVPQGPKPDIGAYERAVRKFILFMMDRSLTWQ